MAVSQSDLDRARQAGTQGGGVNTNGMSWQDRNAIDKAVNDGRRG